MIAWRGYPIACQGLVSAIVAPDFIRLGVGEKIQQSLIVVPAKELSLEGRGQAQQPVDDTFGIRSAVYIVSHEDKGHRLLGALAVLLDLVEQLVQQIPAAMDIADRVDAMIRRNGTRFALWLSPQTQQITCRKARHC